MTELKDYKCNYGKDDADFGLLIANTGLKFPDLHTNAADIAEFARIISAAAKARFCYVPFCHTVEASAFGANINLGDETSGPRSGAYVYRKCEDLLDLPEIDFGTGRIHEVLRACQILKADGFNVALEICGPFTIANALIEIEQVLKCMRKQPELIAKVFDHIGDQLIRYIQAAAPDIDLLCYADPAGGLNILGPKHAESVARSFTLPFLRRAKAALGSGKLIHLCPKTSFILAGLNLAKWHSIDLGRPITFEEACLSVCRDIDFVGQICIKDAQQVLSDGRISGLDLLIDKTTI